jgi:hypothetical protein
MSKLLPLPPWTPCARLRLRDPLHLPAEVVHANQKTVTTMDVVYALKRQGRTLYGLWLAPSVLRHRLPRQAAEDRPAALFEPGCRRRPFNADSGYMNLSTSPSEPSPAAITAPSTSNSSRTTASASKEKAQSEEAARVDDAEETRRTNPSICLRCIKFMQKNLKFPAHPTRPSDNHIAIVFPSKRKRSYWASRSRRHGLSHGAPGSLSIAFRACLDFPAAARPDAPWSFRITLLFFSDPGTYRVPNPVD